MDLDVLTHENYLLYCAKYYNNPQCHDISEFYEDLRRIKYIKKLFTRYEKTGELKERLILNHIIILNNMFGAEHTTKILFLKIDKEHRVYLKPFLIQLSILPRVIYGLAEGKIVADEIGLDLGIVDALRKI
jgi:hypothetical protein